MDRDWSLSNDGVERRDVGRSFAGLLRERWKLIAAVALLTTLAAALYVSTAPRTYRAQADLVTNPIARDNEVLGGLGLLRESSNPTREIETVSRLIPTPEVAERASAKVPADLRDDFRAVEAAPVAQSSIVAITVDAGDPQAASSWANAFGEAFIEVRTQAMRRRANTAIASLQARLRATTNQGVQDQLSLQLTQLQQIVGGNDPTVALETRAAVPTSPISPRPTLSIAAGLIFGLLLGVGGAFALQGLDPRLRREEQLREVYPLPILARISAPIGKRRRGGPSAGASASAAEREMLSPAAIEASWPLRALLSSPRGTGADSKSLAITSANAGEGKTTVALSLAYSLALAGEQVILIDADLRQPELGPTLGISSPATTIDVLTGMSALDEALISSPRFPRALHLLLADAPSEPGDEVAPDAFVSNMPRLIEEAMERAKYVIIAAPPLAETVEAFSLGESVDDVLLVVRLGRTRVARLAELRKLLGDHLGHPAGFAVVAP